jgi:hypothetical protein
MCQFIRLRQGLSTTERDAVLDSLQLNPTLLDPHRFMFPRSAPAVRYMEVRMRLCVHNSLLSS